MSIGIEARLCERALRLRQPAAVAELLGQPFILAGGAMRSAEPRDFDIYGVDAPINLDDVRKRCLDRSLTILDTTGNAVTVILHGQLVQFCRHHKATPMDLVKSFDFSHVQAGVVFNRDGSIDQVVFTTAFKNVEEKSYTPEYLGSEYPLSALARVVKFHDRGDFEHDHDYFIAQLLRIMCDIIRRGFSDEEDFADQCQGISSSFRCSDPNLLFSLLSKKKEGQA